ncbi:unnamed protein product [Tilletia laevis]|uniref:Uncharacterized protein n=1 Tax=Tilletia laevis TaxID=157183 RepID=A0A9N8LWI3_9BASI|nr:unnamed protein product [Tilletia laevis]
MASPPGNGSFAKTSKYCTHLALSADLILGDATSTMSVHEIACTMDDEAGQIHNVTLNCWSREQPLQGLYIVYHVPFATHPNRLGVSDPTTMRRLPDEFDGLLSDGPTLPPAAIRLRGVGAIISVDADRRVGLVQGFTYLNKTHQWQGFKLRLTFEDTARWASWTIPAARNLVDFDCIVAQMGPDNILDVHIRHIMVVGPAPVALMQSLDINVPANNDRAERLRQARAANRLAMEQKKNGVPAEPTATTSTVPTASTATTSSNDPPTESPTGPPSTPTTSGIRKRGRAD